jgi:hypothetical protein
MFNFILRIFISFKRTILLRLAHSTPPPHPNHDSEVLELATAILSCKVTLYIRHVITSGLQRNYLLFCAENDGVLWDFILRSPNMWY